jgi:hypothetical protein
MAMRSRVLTYLAVVTLVGGASLAARPQDVTLRYRWGKGDTVRYRLTQNSTSLLSGLPGGGELTIEQKAIQTIKGVTKDIAADGTATIEQTIEAVRMEMTGPMGTVAYDSDKKDAAGGNPLDATMKQIFTPMVGASFTLVMAPTGTIQRVEGVTGLAAKMFANLPEDPQTAGLFAGLRAGVSDDAVKAQFAQAFNELPQKAIKPGDSWKISFTVPNPAVGTMTTSIDATLQAIEGSGADQVAKFATKVKVTQDPNGKGMMPMGFTAKLTDATGDGDILFDVAKGQMRRSVQRMAISMNMSGTAPDGTVLNMMNNVKSTATVEIVQ